MKRVVALTPTGRDLGERVMAGLADAELWYRPEPFAEKVRQAFRDGDALVMICAAGIVVRTLAPVLGSKQSDPPVVVLDQSGEHVVALLSGHEGGANALAVEIAALIGAQPVLTTANPYLAPAHVAGMGCERGCSEEELHDLLHRCLDSAGIAVDQLSSVTSIDLKRDETGLIKLCERIDRPFEVFSREELAPMEPLLSVRSEYVHRAVGVYGVAESAALLAAARATGGTPELVITKQKSARATCAIARAYPTNSPEHDD